MKNVWKLRTYITPYWRRSLLALALLTAVVFMDLAIPRLVQRIIDQGIAQKNMAVVGQTTVWMLIISAVSMVFAILNNILSVQVGESVARDLRESLFLKIQSFSWGNLDRMNTGLLMVRLSSDASIFQRLTQVMLRIGTRAPLLMIGSLILMFNTDQRLALMMLPLLLITSLIMWIFISRMEPLFRSVQVRLDKLNTVLQENIAGARLIKAFVRHNHERSRFGVVNAEFAQRSTLVIKYMSTMMPALSLFVNLGMVAVIWIGGLQAIEGGMTIGEIVAFSNYLMTTMVPLMMMGMISNVLAAGAASAERLVEILDTQPEVQDDPDAQPLPHADGYQVRLEHVSFHYSGSTDELVLEDISLLAEPGQTVAILGATGSGKSTLVNLVPRFYDVTSGRLTVNGLDVRKIRQSDLLSIVAIVPQETVLFSGSVRENIRYGSPDASEAEVIAAAQAAQAHEFILSLPQGYDTHIEERGVNLSGGQKQRLAIARALLPRPKILILDDSTSSVDVETETKIQFALKKRLQQTTVLVVAQRISTVLNADKIVVIDQGRIAAEGTHSDLIRTSPIYREIYASQLGDGPLGDEPLVDGPHIDGDEASDRASLEGEVQR